jgi:hypothetical protein
MSIVNLQNEPIYVRSPYIIEIDQPNILGSKVELFIWNNGTTPPTAPTYTLEKLIPSPSSTEMVYNVSNYVREYINFVESTIVETATPTVPPDNEWAYIKVIRYTLTITGYEVLDTKTYYAFDGFGYYEEGFNPELGTIHLTPGNYEYWYDANNPGSVFPQPFLNRYGEIHVVPKLNYEVVYTSLANGSTQSFTFNPGVIGPVQKFYTVFPTYSDVGNIVEYKTDTGTVIATWTFTPKSECKYTPVVCDFVNKYGVWQRIIFYKVSKTSIAVKKKTYDLLARDLVNYNPALEQTKVFNLNATQSIKVNTDWVKEEYNERILKPLMLSEIIRINGKPATLKTSATELFEHINKKQINYELEFTFANATINNVV